MGTREALMLLEVGLAKVETCHFWKFSDGYHIGSQMSWV